MSEMLVCIQKTCVYLLGDELLWAQAGTGERVSTCRWGTLSGEQRWASSEAGHWPVRQ